MSGPQRDALVDAVFGEGRMSLADAAAAVDVVIAAGWRPPTEPTAEDFAATLRAESVRRVDDSYVHHAVIRDEMRRMADTIERWERGDFQPSTEPTAERRTPRLDALTRHVRDRKAEPTTEPTCAATYSSPHEDEVVYVCGEPATREWLDLTGRWSPVCDAHSAGRGVPADRLRPLPTAEPTWRAPNVVARELVDAWEESTAEGMSIGALREAIISACDLGGAYGQNIHESKAVLLRLGEQAVPLTQVSVGFHSGTGSFVMYLTAAQPTAERAGDADDVAAVDAAARVIGEAWNESLVWDVLDGKPSISGDTDVKAAIRERHRDVARRVLAAQPAAVPDPAEALRAAVEAVLPTGPRSHVDLHSMGAWDLADRLRAVLGDPSGALAEVKAEAWDEGHRVCINYGLPLCRENHPNPYRLAADPGSPQ